MENGKKPEVIIVAPHPDDEIIGCYSILMNKEFSPIIVYTENVPNERREEALKLKDFIPNIKIQLFQKTIPGHFLSPYNTYYFPDPTYEFHPAHRMSGAIGETFLREMRYNIIFYNVNMQAPYIFEVPSSEYKKKLLNDVYSSQKRLWENDAKYYLFEGYCKWLI
jgi:hypothetical protein